MSLLRLALGALCVLALTAAFIAGSCGRSAEPGDFRVLAIEPGDGRLARNQAIVVRFSRELGEDVARSTLIRVRRASGAALPLEMSTSGRSLIMRRADGKDWPSASTLSLEIRRGFALSIKARDGAPLRETFRSSLTVSDEYLDQGEPFLLVREPKMGRKALGSGAELRFGFNLAIDASSLSRSLSLIRANGDRTVPPFRIEDDARTIVVSPFSGAFAAAPGEACVLRLESGLRSRTARTLAGPPREFRLRRSPSLRREGVIDFSFRGGDLPPEENSALPADQKGAHPERGGLRAVVLNRDFASKIQGRELVTAPLSRRRSRLQVLLSGESLGDDPVLITGVSFWVLNAPDVVPSFPRFLLRVGVLASELGELGVPAEANFAEEPQSVATVAEASLDGEWTPNSADIGSLRQTGGYGWLELKFAQPFPYPGQRRDLVVEFENGAGCFPVDPDAEFPVDWKGLDWAAGTPTGSPRVRALLWPLTGEKARRNLVFATKLRVERYLEYVSAWREASAEDPRYFRVPVAADVEAEGTPGVDFRFDFQGRRPDGSVTSWGRLEALNGCRNIRSRLVFLPTSARAAAGEVEVRRLRVRYEQND
jgi:hypothetical protein